MSKRSLKNKLFVFIVGILFVSMASFGVFTLLTSFFSLSKDDGSSWDGVSVSSSFSSGNGSSDNPFIIKSGADLAYFKEVIEGINSSTFNELYYELGSNIDLGDKEFQTIGKYVDGEEHIFKGNFDGNGYTIKNARIVGNSGKDVELYGLFGSVEGATISNFNLENVDIYTKSSGASLMIGNIASEVRSGSTIKNISVLDNTIDLTLSNDNGNKIGTLFGVVSNNVIVKNIAVDSNLSSKFVNGIAKVSHTINSSLDNIVVNVEVDSLLLEKIDNYVYSSNNSIISNLYEGSVIDNRLVLSSNTNSVVDSLNYGLIDEFVWEYNSNKIKLVRTVEDEVIVPLNFSFGQTVLTEHETGVVGDTAYLNDLSGDYNDFMGRNYTWEDSANYAGDGTSKNKYNDTNLVKTFIQYNGQDAIDPSVVGYVSNTEAVSKFNFYKYYYVEDGYITIQLMDHPFGRRPNNMGFGGWVTDYEGATIWYDGDIHYYFAKVPVTDVTQTINIVFYARWVPATVATLSSVSNTNIDNALNSFAVKGFKKVGSICNSSEDLTTLYIKKTVNYNSMISRYTYNEDMSYNSGSVRCTNRNGCVVYQLSSEDYVAGETYYRLVQEGTVLRMDIADIQVTCSSDVGADGVSSAGLFVKKTLVRGDSLVGLHNSSGNYITSGTYTSGDYYELLQFKDSNGNPNVIDLQNGEYYTVVNRDTQILFLNTDGNANNLFSRTSYADNKAFTVTGQHNGSTRSPNIQVSTAANTIGLKGDLRVEYVRMTSNARPSSYSTSDNSSVTRSTTLRTSNMIFGAYYNLKLGRGIEDNGTYLTAVDVIGGTNKGTGSAAAPTRYSLIVESGYYSRIGVVCGYRTGLSIYTQAYATYGSDYDRALNTDAAHQNLRIYKTAAGTFGGNVNVVTGVPYAVDLTVKSGQFGTNGNYFTDGIYVGGLSGGSNKAVRKATVEGGQIFNLIGGPSVDPNRKAYTLIYTTVKGGEVDFVFGGAGETATQGHRALNIAGGTINGAAFGGSNAKTGTSGDGTLQGNTVVYVGGDAVVGGTVRFKKTSNDVKYNEHPGSVFGAGNGNTSDNTIGTVYSSAVVIDGNAHVNGSVFGGGNYGGVGTTLDDDTESSIKILGGTIDEAVYAGGNNNGGGKNATYTCDMNIEMTGGTVGNIYGGSRLNGVVYGNSTVNVISGTVINDIYGGGEGGYASTSSRGTYVTGNINVNIGKSLAANVAKPVLNIGGSVYGGSAYGTVNGSTENGSANTSLVTNVNVHYGNISKSVFGGGKGSSTLTPKVYGKVTVTVNDGNIGNVYGGNDAKGQPAGSDVVILNGGTIGDAFGGGNSTGQNTTDIRLIGATVNRLFGGSNASGDVTTTNVSMTGGTVTDVYGGNNVGTSTNTTNVNISGGTVNGDIYGGGLQAPVYSSTKLTINNMTVKNVYGGGQSADVHPASGTATATTNVNITNSNGSKVFGGSNFLGTVDKSNVTINGTRFTSIYGGNNAGGTTSATNVTINSGTFDYVYGGGDKALSGDTVVLINNATITDLFGGGNEAGIGKSDVDIIKGKITNVYGGSNADGDVTSTDIHIGTELVSPITATVKSNSHWQQNTYQAAVSNSITITNNTNSAISDIELEIVAPADFVEISIWNGYTYEINGSTLTLKSGTNSVAANSSVTFDMNVVIDKRVIYNENNKLSDYALSLNKVIKPVTSIDNSTDLSVDNVYGGNNLGGSTGPTKVYIETGYYKNIYGGGNKATAGSTDVTVNYSDVANMFGGGKAASVNGNTKLVIYNSNFTTNVFGGGDEGSVSGNTEVFVTDSTISGSLYAGGNGITATVHGNTNVVVDGNTVVGTPTSKAPHEGCVFGGGNKALTGTEAVGNSTATVNIVGGHVYGNVYGGANTSIVYGATRTNIGKAVVANGNSFKQHDIIVNGTVFGGGEANADGNEEYDFDFFSVVGSIDIFLDGTGYEDSGYDYKLSGSIFGSGNASSSSGTSNISVKKLGTKEKTSMNISFQRTNTLTIDNSYIELSGIEDRTNEFSSIKYSFNQIDKLIIKNNTTLLLKKNANLLKELYSGVDVDGTLVPSVVTIDDSSKTVTKNVDNRIYMLPFNNLNVTTTQDATSYGKITGMTFFGMYNSSGNGSSGYGIYDYDKSYGDTTSADDMIVGSSYVLGLHHNNHDITVDGFYTNVFNEGMTEVITEYIEPSPPSSNFYRWMIGMQTINYTVDLTASKYSSLGTYALTMLDFPDGDTSFELIGFNAGGLNSDINLIRPNSIPRLADTEEEANTTFGLAMKSETREWTHVGVTEFTDADGATGDKMFKTDSQPVAPSLMFYLYYPKNITREGDIGSVLITLESAEPINEIEYEYNLVTITVNMVAKNYDDGNSYDASITYDKHYSMPSATTVNITNQSQFTAYYSLYARGKLKEIYGENYENYHVLTSTYAFPVGTQITMIDYGYDINNPQYYYYNITQSIYDSTVTELDNYGEIAYRLDNFVRMGSTSTNNKYVDNDANKKYYNASKETAMEEFVFIIDMKETTTTGEHIGNSILFELRSGQTDAEILTVLGIRRQLMMFGLYDTSNVVLQENIVSESEYLYYNTVNNLDFASIVGYEQNANGATIIDTNYESSAMGLNMYFYDSSGNQVSSSALTGTVLTVDNKSIFADGDGVFRVKMAGKVSNLAKKMTLLVDKTLPTGQYTLKFVLFASADGLHNSSLEKSAIVDLNVTVVGDENAIFVTTDDKTKVVDGATGLNQLGENFNSYLLTYRSVLVNPNVRVELYKRDNSNHSTVVYNEVEFNELFTNQLNPTSYRTNYKYEKSLSAVANTDSTYKFDFKENLNSGTYKLVFRLYDSVQLIEEEVEYIIVTKEVVKES